MRAPISWLAEYVDLPPGITPRELGDALVRVGLEVERVESDADALIGPIVVGRVVSFADEPQRNGKTIRWCSVDVAEPQPRGIVCGADNFTPGDAVVVALPGAVLPGGFAIGARRTYGHVSDGMICSARELGLADDADGILVLTAESATPGDDARDVLGLRDAVLDISVTPDRGYCLSVRGLAREAGTALGVAFRDVAEQVDVPEPDEAGHQVRVDDPAGCPQFAARTITGLDPTAASPAWLAHRLRAVGMRPISLAVDVTNYVMQETGQPLHAYDRSKVRGPLVVRRARPGERLRTLDGVLRQLDPDDIVVTDDTGPVGLAGVMGGASTQIDAHTTDIVLEAANWAPAAIARTVRRHKLPSEAAKRFERGVDPRIAGVALQRCVDLLAGHGGARAGGGTTVVGAGPSPSTITIAAALPAQLAGMPIDEPTVRRRLEQVGCAVEGDQLLRVVAPSWRPDLTDPADLVEEVVRLEGYDKIPSALPTPPPGRGLAPAQLLRRAVSRAVAAAGYTEVTSYPFVAPAVHDAFGEPADDPRRRAAALINPLSDGEPELRTSLLPGLLTTVQRNLGRGSRDLALMETGLVFLPRPDAPVAPPLGVAHRPSDEQISEQDAALPDQPRHLAVVLTGQVERAGWWGPGRSALWADAIEAARVVARAARADLVLRRAEFVPWHPGRCAELVLAGAVIGHAGELAPRVLAALDLPARTAAMELDLDAFGPAPPATVPPLSGYPPVFLDIALVVAADVPASTVLAAVREGAGELLESARLFDVYVDADRLGPGRKSLAFALRLRAADRTLTLDEAASARDAAVQLSQRRVGAELRS